LDELICSFSETNKAQRRLPPYRKRERVFETGHLDISQRLLASQKAKEGLAFSFSVDTEIHLSSSTMNTWKPLLLEWKLNNLKELLWC
jgi:hypothetical protein